MDVVNNYISLLLVKRYETHPESARLSREWFDAGSNLRSLIRDTVNGHALKCKKDVFEEGDELEDSTKSLLRKVVADYVECLEEAPIIGKVKGRDLIEQVLKYTDLDPVSKDAVWALHECETTPTAVDCALYLYAHSKKGNRRICKSLERRTTKAKSGKDFNVKAWRSFLLNVNQNRDYPFKKGAEQMHSYEKSQASLRARDEISPASGRVQLVRTTPAVASIL